MPSPHPPNGRAVDRRSFLTAAALGGAAIVGASALGAFDADAAFAAPTPSLDPVAKSAFAEGVIRTRDGNLLTVAGSHGERHRVQVTNATSIWKLEFTDANAIEIGDGMYGRGVQMPDGTIAADAVWLNIVNLVGDIEAVGRERIQLRHGEHSVHGRVVLGTTVASVNGRAASADLSGLRVGHAVEVIGAWRPADDSVDIARVTARG